VAGFRILLKPSAAKEIEAVGSKRDRRRIVERISALASDPRSAETEKLAGYEDRYRVRQGHHRIVCLIDDGRREVTVFEVGHRKDVDR
jgi:mRNA interferase RelE/StbE